MPAFKNQKKPKAKKPKVKAAPQQDAPRPNGRPTVYKPEYVKQAEKLCKLGATDAELADFFGVTTVTIWRWQSRYEGFCKALKAGKSSADDRVERSLFQKAVGYTYNSEKVFQHDGEIVRADIVEHVPPDHVACFFWLKNRKPTEWRDKQEIETSNKVYHISDKPLTEDEWAKQHVTDD